MYESPRSELVMCHMSSVVVLMREREREKERERESSDLKLNAQLMMGSPK
jgi:hypothetical protein